MIVSTLIFLVGSPFYRRLPVTESVAVKFVKAVKDAIGNKITGAGEYEEPVKHWLDRAVGPSISVS